MEVNDDIIERCREGDNGARYELYTCYSSTLMGVAMRYVGSMSSAEDVVQDAFIRIFTSITKFKNRGAGSLRAWLVGVTVNVALESLRRRSKELCVSLDEVFIDKLEEPSFGEVEALSYEEMLTLLGTLPEGYRTIFNLYYIEEYSHKEIASMLGINHKSSASQLVRAKRALAERVKIYLSKRDGER